jgi:hypothetical protein
MEPKYVVNPSTVLAVVKTAGSLLAFAVLFFGTVMRFLSARDLAGLFVYLQQNDTIAGLTMLATAGWFVWRNLAAYWRKQRDVEIAQAAPNSVAVVK